MTRAILIVLDSVGCGGAEDAKAYGDEGADTLGHIAEACAERRRRPRRPEARPLEAAAPRGARARPGDEGFDRPRAAGLCAPRAARTVGLRRRDLARQGHAVRPLGACRNAGRLRLGLFSRDDPRFSRRPDGGAHRRRQACRDSRQPPRLGHGGDRGLRRGAPANAEAHLLHLRRLGAPDRRARRGLRARSALRSYAESRAGSAIRSTSAASSPGLSSAQAPRTLSAPPIARISRFPRRTATCCSGPPARAALSFRSARSATSSPIATPGTSARAKATTATSTSSSTR